MKMLGVHVKAPKSNSKTYIPVIGGVTTAPTKGTGGQDLARWREDGECMEIIYTFQNGSGGSAGSGIYLISIPPGFAIDLTKVQIIGATYDNQENSNVGSATYGVGGSANQFGSVHVVSSTQLVVRGYGETSTGSQYFGSSFTPLNNSNIFCNITCKVPIVGWSSNDLLRISDDTKV